MTFPEHDWQILAACRGMDARIFLSAAEDRVSSARTVCAICPVQQRCLQYALNGGERFGVWGGMSEDDRRRLARRRSPATTASHRNREAAGAR